MYLSTLSLANEWVLVSDHKISQVSWLDFQDSRSYGQWKGNQLVIYFLEVLTRHYTELVDFITVAQHLH